MIPPPRVLKRGPGDPDSLVASITCATLAARVTLFDTRTARISPQNGSVCVLIPGARWALFSAPVAAFRAVGAPFRRAAAVSPATWAAAQPRDIASFRRMDISDIPVRLHFPGSAPYLSGRAPLANATAALAPPPWDACKSLNLSNRGASL